MIVWGHAKCGEGCSLTWVEVYTVRLLKLGENFQSTVTHFESQLSDGRHWHSRLVPSCFCSFMHQSDECSTSLFHAGRKPRKQAGAAGSAAAGPAKVIRKTRKDAPPPKGEPQPESLELNSCEATLFKSIAIGVFGKSVVA